MEVHGIYLCTKCGFESESRNERYEHDRKGTCDSLKCEQCDYESGTKEIRGRKRNLATHIKSVHENIKKTETIKKI